MQNKNEIFEIECGIMLSEIAFCNIPLVFKSGKMDYFIIDDEHGGFDYSDLRNVITTARLCGIKCIVRLPDNSRRDITKLMDMGADGLLLPMTCCANDIEQVVEYAKYAPTGKRGISTMRAHTFYNPPPVEEYMKSANMRTEIYAQIETAQGVDNAESIIAVRGVSGAFVGPNDLSCDYGCMGDKNAPQVLSAIEKVAECAKKADKKSGIITGNDALLAKARASGMNMFCVGSELNAIKSGCLSVAAKIKGGSKL